MKIIKHFFILFIFIIFGFISYNLIYKFLEMTNFIEKSIIIDNNKYAKDYDYVYVSLTNDFYAKDYNHLLNIIYTIVNSGNETFTFYCDRKYESCSQDLKRIIKEKEELYVINNFVHPFNSFDKIDFYGNEYEFDINLEKIYNENEINYINDEINKILINEINNNMSDEDKIKRLHNYIINNYKYDKDNLITNNNKANNLLQHKLGICSSYTDLMTIMLNKLNINNYKIATENHVWNLVNINNKWLHVDVTFDDPITTSGKDIILDDMLLVDTNELLHLDNKNHNFDKTIYLEAN